MWAQLTTSHPSHVDVQVRRVCDVSNNDQSTERVCLEVLEKKNKVAVILYAERLHNTGLGSISQD